LHRKRLRKRRNGKEVKKETRKVRLVKKEGGKRD